MLKFRFFFMFDLSSKWSQEASKSSKSIKISQEANPKGIVEAEKQRIINRDARVFT